MRKVPGVVSPGRKGKVCSSSSCPRGKLHKPQKQQAKIKGEKMRKREKNGEVGITKARVVLQGLLFLVLKLSSPQCCGMQLLFSCLVKGSLLSPLAWTHEVQELKIIELIINNKNNRI